MANEDGWTKFGEAFPYKWLSLTKLSLHCALVHECTDSHECVYNLF